MFFRAFMCIEKSGFKKEDSLADSAEPEVSRLNYPGMHGTDRDFVDAFALQPP